MNATQLKAWRNALDITQEQAADLIGVSWRHYQRLEAGHRISEPIARYVRTLTRLASLTE